MNVNRRPNWKVFGGYRKEKDLLVLVLTERRTEAMRTVNVVKEGANSSRSLSIAQA